MSDQTLRAAIAARLTALGPTIGRVHDYERWSANSNRFLQLFQDPDTKKIFGWEITRRSFRVQKMTMQKWKLIHGYTLRGYYAMQDDQATEKAINVLVDTIVFDFTRTKIAGTQGEQLPEGKIDVRQFANVLCHVAEIQLPEVAEIVERLPEAGEVDLLTAGLEYYLKPGDDVLDASDELSLAP